MIPKWIYIWAKERKEAWFINLLISVKYFEDHYFFVWWYTLLFFPWQNYAFPQLKILLQIVWHWHFVMIAGILDKIRYLIVHLTIIEKQTVQSIFRREINICSIIYILVSTVTNNRWSWLKNYTKFFVRIVS